MSGVEGGSLSARGPPEDHRGGKVGADSSGHRAGERMFAVLSRFASRRAVGSGESGRSIPASLA